MRNALSTEIQSLLDLVLASPICLDNSAVRRAATKADDAVDAVRRFAKLLEEATGKPGLDRKLLIGVLRAAMPEDASETFQCYLDGYALLDRRRVLAPKLRQWMILMVSMGYDPDDIETMMDSGAYVQTIEWTSIQRGYVVAQPRSHAMLH